MQVYVRVWVSLFQLAELHIKLDHIPEATKLVTAAMHEFAGTPEEVRVVIANSEIAMKRGDTDAAIHMLGNIPPTSSAYTKAQMVKADILLKVRLPGDGLLVLGFLGCVVAMLPKRYLTWADARSTAATNACLPSATRTWLAEIRGSAAKFCWVTRTCGFSNPKMRLR